MRCAALGEGCATLSDPDETGNVTPCGTCTDATVAEVNSGGTACVCKGKTTDGGFVPYFDTDLGTDAGNLKCEPLGKGCDARDAAKACLSCANPYVAEVKEDLEPARLRDHLGVDRPRVRPVGHAGRARCPRAAGASGGRVREGARAGLAGASEGMARALVEGVRPAGWAYPMRCPG